MNDLTDIGTGTDVAIAGAAILVVLNAGRLKSLKLDRSNSVTSIDRLKICLLMESLPKTSIEDLSVERSINELILSITKI